MTKSKELRALTGIRGVAALYVVCFHFWGGIGFANPFTRLLSHGYLGVDLFFILSGFVMTLTYGSLFERGCSKETVTSFLLKRLARVYPLYLLATMIGFAMEFASANKPYIFLQLFENLLMVQVWLHMLSLDGAAWSISAEWAAYLIFPWLVATVYQGRAALGWVAATVCTGVLGALCYLPDWIVGRSDWRAPLNLHDAHWGMSVWRCIAEFILGMLLMRLRNQSLGRFLAESRRVAGLLTIVICILLLLRRTDFLVVMSLPPLILSLTSDTANKVSRFLASQPVHYLGLISYSLYMVHALLVPLLDKVHQIAHEHGFNHAQTYAAAIG